MRVLFVSTNFPTDLRTKVHGRFKRMGMFIDAIKQLAGIDFLFYVPSEVDVSPAQVSLLERVFSEHWHAALRLFLCPRFVPSRPASRWQRYGPSAWSFFKLPGYLDTSGPQQVRAFETCLARKPDAIFVDRLASMCPALLTQEPLPPIFFDLDDIEHIAFLRALRLEPSWRARLLHSPRLPLLCWGEKRAIHRAQLTFVCSDLDRRYLARRWRLSGVVTIPNAVSIPAIEPLSEAPTLLFIGSYAYQPNVYAAEFLITQVWPRVYRSMPQARLLLAGGSPERVRGYMAGVPGVEFTGFVDDLDALYRRSRVVCAPVFSGGGTRIKIIEAAAYGKPIVATGIGAEGLEMRDGMEVVLRQDAESFADACLHLLTNREAAQRLGAAARAAAIRHYERSAVVRLIRRRLSAYMHERPRPTGVVSRKSHGYPA